MNLFEYISVLTSIVVGLGIAHLLSGVAKIVQHPGRHKVYWVHLVWVGSLFFNLIFFWWWEFSLATRETWYFQDYLFIVFYAVLLYLLCAMLFPSDLEGYEGFADYFLSRRVWFFGLFGATGILDLYDTMMKGMEHFRSLGTDYLIVTATFLIFAVTGAVTRRHSVHAAVAVLTLCVQIWWAFQYWSEQA